MSQSFERLLGGVATAIVDTSRARPWLTIALCTLATVFSVYVTATSLEIDTDSDRILSSEMPVRQTNIALAKAFPEQQNNLIIMVDADEGDDARDAVEELTERLREEPERYPMVFLPGDAPYYEDFGLLHLERDDLEEMADRIENAGPLLATLAERPELPILLGALQHAIQEPDGLESIGPDGVKILDRLANTVERANAGERAPIEWDDLLFDDVGPEPDNPQLLFVRPAGDLTQMEPVLLAIDAIRGMAAELEPRAGLRVRVTGDRAVHTEEMSLVIEEAILAGAASLIGVTLLLLYSLRSFRLVTVTVLTLIFGLTWTAGLATLAVGHLNALTSAFAVLYIGLGVDFGIHFALGYLEQRALDKDRAGALNATGSIAGSSLIFCALTTAIGFYAFIPTSYSGVADMGIISGSGVFLGLIATLTLYPAFISLGFGESERLAKAPLQKLQIGLPRLPLEYPRAVCAAAAVITLACMASLTQVRFDANTLNVRDPRVESVQALKDLLTDSERSAWTIDVLTHDLDEAVEVAALLEAFEEVESVNTAMSFMPEEQEASLVIFERMRSDLEAPIELTEDETGDDKDRALAIEYTIEGYGVALDLDAELRFEEPEDDSLDVAADRLRQALLAYLARLPGETILSEIDSLEEDLFGELPELHSDLVDALPQRAVTLADLPEDLMQRYISADGRARVEIFSATDLNEPGALDRFSDLVHSVRPDAGGPAAGTVALGRAIVSSLRQALVTALVVITLLLIVLWRSLKYTLITLTPLFVGTMATAAVSVIAGVPFNFANIIVLPLILGIGVDSGIHLVHRHRTGLQGADNLLRTSTANAVLFSAATTFVSFATLSVSNHLGIASLGQLLAIGIALMLAANALVLPAILTLVDGD
jgi:hypothetical protein